MVVGIRVEVAQHPVRAERHRRELVHLGGIAALVRHHHPVEEAVGLFPGSHGGQVGHLGRRAGGHGRRVRARPGGLPHPVGNDGHHDHHRQGDEADEAGGEGSGVPLLLGAARVTELRGSVDRGAALGAGLLGCRVHAGRIHMSSLRIECCRGE